MKKHLILSAGLLAILFLLLFCSAWRAWLQRAGWRPPRRERSNGIPQRKTLNHMDPGIV